MARILSVDPAFDRMAGEIDLVLGDADRLPPGDPQLFGNQVDSCDHFGYGVLHLNPGVHFHEIKAPATVQQKLNRSCTLIIDAAGCCYSCIAHSSSKLGVQCRTRCFLQQLLVAALNRAIPLPQMNHVAVAICQHLHFHMTWPVDEFLHVQARVAEGGLRFPLGCFVQIRQLIGTGHEAHTPATTACGGLDHHRIAHLFRQDRSLLGIGQQTFTSRNGGDTHRLHRRLGCGFIPH